MPPTPEGRRVQWVVLMGVGACVCTLTPYAGCTPRPGCCVPHTCLCCWTQSSLGLWAHLSCPEPPLPHVAHDSLTRVAASRCG